MVKLIEEPCCYIYSISNKKHTINRSINERFYAGSGRKYPERL